MGSVLQRTLRLLCPWRNKQLSESRTIYVNNRNPNANETVVLERFCSNQVVSSKYTVWNFLPKNLYEQFHRLANFYFLVIAIIQLTTDAPVSPYTSLIPLTIVISVTAIKQGYEDWLRHKADREVNNREVFVLRGIKLESIRAMEIQVGDIIKVSKNENIPSDLVLLSSDNPDGHCYVTTANLDGESNLKTYFSAPNTVAMKTLSQLSNLNASIECQQPMADLYQFVGRMNVFHPSGIIQESQTVSLGPENLLLRGTMLKNTPYIYGCAIYTGQETKISLNSRTLPHKYSRVERRMNRFLVFFLCILFLYSSVWVVLTLWYYSQNSHSTNVMWYLPTHNALSFWKTPSKNTNTRSYYLIQTFFSFTVLLNYVIPISLYMCIELQKFLGSRFFQWDLEMYCEKTDEPAKAITSDLNEELGQVEYLFTDKTGTLTENNMVFRQCSVRGVIYEEREGELCRRIDFPVISLTSYQCLDRDEYEEIDNMLIGLAVCHTVRVDSVNEELLNGTSNGKLNGGSSIKKQHEIEYQSSSPDEKALVEACRRMSLILVVYFVMVENPQVQIVDIAAILRLNGEIMEQQKVQTSMLQELLRRQHGFDGVKLSRLPDNIRLPVTTYAEITDLETLLKSEDIYKQVLNRLALFGGATVRECVHHIMDRIMENELIGKTILLDRNQKTFVLDRNQQQEVLLLLIGTEQTCRFGVVFHGTRDNEIQLTVHDRKKIFRLRHVLDFDPTRKRMSVIVSDQSGKNWLYSKGADSSMLERIKKGDLVTLESHINNFAKFGLRILVVAKKSISNDELEHFTDLLVEAKNALQNRDAKLATAYDFIETDLCLLGATAVEDRLQEGVAETIESLRQAGIKVWVLTGDKEETAVNVSFAAGHLTDDMKMFHLTNRSLDEDCFSALQGFKAEIDSSRDADFREDDYDDENDCKHALVMDGKSLECASKNSLDLLRSVCESCTAVLCCRLSPLQKAQVVRLIKKSKRNPTTAAIGDGANDVGMILEAHVGLGILGKEGRQAAQSSNYAIAQFRFLRRAILVHGHYFYVRISTLVQFFFYKNIAMVTSQAYFTFYTGFSAQTLYDAFFLMFYNTTFTSLPILCYGLLEKNFSPDYLLKNPRLYRSLRRNSRLTLWNFLKWVCLGVWHSVVFFFGTYLAIKESSLFYNGKDVSNYDFGAIVMMMCVFSVNIKLMLETYNFNWITFGGYAVTLVGYYALTLFYTSMMWKIPATLTIHRTMLGILSSPTIWLLLLLLVVTALLPDIIIRVLNDTFNPVFRHNRTKRKLTFNRQSTTITLSSFSESRSTINAVDGSLATCSSNLSLSTV